jgi:hypothetical protein
MTYCGQNYECVCMFGRASAYACAGVHVRRGEHLLACTCRPRAPLQGADSFETLPWERKMAGCSTHTSHSDSRTGLPTKEKQGSGRKGCGVGEVEDGLKGVWKQRDTVRYMSCWNGCVRIDSRTEEKTDAAAVICSSGNCNDNLKSNRRSRTPHQHRVLRSLKKSLELPPGFPSPLPHNIDCSNAP